MSIAPHGRVRPAGRRHQIWSSAFSQSREHSQWCPPGFEELRSISDDMDSFFDVACTVKHPLAHVEVELPADLACAVDKVCELRHATPAWRLRRMQSFERVAASLEGWSSQLRFWIRQVLRSRSIWGVDL